MTTPWNEKQIFLHALGLSGDERERYLRDACPDQQSLLRIRELLRSHELASGSFLETPPEHNPVPEPIDRPLAFDEFRIIRKLGSGGMGTVYLATDEVLDRTVALKILSQQLTDSARARARFEDEAKLAASLQHPNIVTVYKYGEVGGDCYMASAYVEGSTFADLISNRTNNQTDEPEDRQWKRRVAEICASVGEALQAAHNQRIVHRDIKPSNILIDVDGKARLTDFGIAKRLSDSLVSDQTSVIGSCHYMSPEQASIEQLAIDERSDIFSLGVAMYEALSLTKPFDGDTIHEVLHAIRTTEPKGLRTIDRSIDRDLETICHKAIEKVPVARYQTAAHMAADLRCWLRGDPILASPPTALRKITKALNRRKAIIIIGSTLTGGAVAGAVLSRRLTDERPILDLRGLDPTFRVSIRRIDTDTGLAASPENITKIKRGLHRIDPGYVRIQLHHPSGFIEELTRYISPDQTLTIHTAAHQQSSTIGGGRSTEGMIHFDPSLAGNDQRSETESSFSSRMQKLAPFWIEATETTNQEYEQYVIDSKTVPEPKVWHGAERDSDWNALPVTGVNWFEARGYAEWRGRRLPTSDEWEFAARGPSGRRYPWGNTDDPTKSMAVNSNSLVNHANPLDKANPLGAWGPSIEDENRRMYLTEHIRPANMAGADVTPSGMRHCMGNVMEWTESIPLISMKPAEIYRVVRGGAWSMGPVTLDQSVSRLRARDDRRIGLGFRCALSDI